jgi:hypothetical protein
LDIIALWYLPDGQHVGQHYIIGINLGPQQLPVGASSKTLNLGRSLFEQTEREKTALISSIFRNRHIKEETPVKIILHASDSVLHEFNGGEKYVHATVHAF